MAKKVASDIVYSNKNIDELDEFEKSNAIFTVIKDPSILNGLDTKQYEIEL